MRTSHSAARGRKGGARRREQGGATVPVLIVLAILASALGVNYYRNYVGDQEIEATNRPFANYPTTEIPVLLEAYQMALEVARSKQVGGRVRTRERYRFTAQIEEFERVQRETRKVRERAIDVAEIQSNIDALKTEQQHRASNTGEIMLHVTRLFRI